MDIVRKKTEQSNKSVTETSTETAIVNNVINPITVEVIQGNQKIIIGLIGLNVPDIVENKDIYEFALNFTKFHLHKGKKIRLQKDIYNTNSKTALRYLFIDGEMYNKLLLANGYAFVSNTTGEFEYRTEFQSIEQKAQDSGLGFWNDGNVIVNNQEINTKTTTQIEPAGTLPKINLPKHTNTICDYTNNNTPVIKGNYDKKTKNKTYYLPTSIFYKTIAINPDAGDKLLCTESEAEKNGWIKSKH